MQHSIVENNLICYAGTDVPAENWHCDVTEYRNNLFWGYQAPPTTGSNHLTLNPKLQAAGTGKTAESQNIALDSLQGYQLSADSPAIGAGTTVPASVTHDFFANPVTDPPSIGAHQPALQTKG